MGVSTSTLGKLARERCPPVEKKEIDYKALVHRRIKEQIDIGKRRQRERRVILMTSTRPPHYHTSTNIYIPPNWIERVLSYLREQELKVSVRQIDKVAGDSFWGRSWFSYSQVIVSW